VGGVGEGCGWGRGVGEGCGGGVSVWVGCRWGRGVGARTQHDRRRRRFPQDLDMPAELRLDPRTRDLRCLRLLDDVVIESSLHISEADTMR
jgi:hypothetical protein